MLTINGTELRKVLENGMEVDNSLVFLGTAGSGKTLLAKEVVSILGESRKVGFVTEDTVEGSLTYIEDALLLTDKPDVWVVDAVITQEKKEALEATGAKVVWFVSANRSFGVVAESTSVDGKLTVEDDRLGVSEVYNVAYFIEA